MAGVNLPVDAVRRMIFVFQPSEVFDYDLPLVIDVSGLYFRHETGKIIMTGKSILDEPPGFNFKVNNSFFNQTMWPILADRIPVFDRLKLIKGWAGLYEINRLDSNAFGAHPELEGFTWPLLQRSWISTGLPGKAIRTDRRRYETIDVSSSL
jgi:glycine/D-amino acid oxidase-like deaminating enzyme